MSNISFETLQNVYVGLEYGFGIPVIVINAIIILIILKHTPPEMKTYGKLLLNQTIWELLCAIFICFLLQPVFLWPIDGVVVSGPANQLGHYPAYCFSLLSLQLYGQCLISLVACFIYRYQRLSDDNQPRFLTPRTATAFILYFAGNGFFLYTQLSSYPGERTDIVASIIETRPFWSVLSMKMVILFPTKNKFTELGTNIGALLGTASCFSCFVIFFLIKRRLQEIRTQLSDKTYKMHRNLTMGLLVQMLAPIVCIAIPVAVGKMLDYYQINSDFVTPIGFSAMVYYHCLSAFATLYFVKPYGKAFMHYLKMFASLTRLQRAYDTKRNSSLPKVSIVQRRITIVN